MSINVVSLFSGGGGLDLGFIAEGYNIIWAIDNNKNATETYKANIGDHIMCADINQIDISKIPHADVVIGGPPCQSFSLAGNRNVEDERGQLVWKYIHIIEQVQPKAFVFENVTGLLSAQNSQGEKIIELLKIAFKKIGYTIEQQVMEDLAEARGLVRSGNYDALELLYEDIPDTLSQLIRTAFVPQKDRKFIVADFSAIEARVLAWLAGEQWRLRVFEEGKDIYCSSASQMFGVPVEKHGVNGHLRQKGKIAELALGYGGSVGALKAMGALEMGLTEEELQPLVSAWRNANPMITRLWWDIDRAVKTCVKEKSRTETHGIVFHYQSGFLFLTLPSGRQLAYVKPRMGENQFGGEAVTYEGVGATKKWERLESYGPKFTENVVQAIANVIPFSLVP